MRLEISNKSSKIRIIAKIIELALSERFMHYLQSYIKKRFSNLAQAFDCVNHEILMKKFGNPPQFHKILFC